MGKLQYTRGSSYIYSPGSGEAVARTDCSSWGGEDTFSGDEALAEAPRRELFTVYKVSILWRVVRVQIHSLFSRYYNGGTLEEFIEKYAAKKRPVPEHFVWLVAERLAEVIRYFNFGTVPGTDDELDDWDRTYIGSSPAD